MKAVAVINTNDVQIVDDVPIPQHGEYEALVKVHACGLCSGTDLAIIDGHMTKADRFAGFPTILGHEGCGEIVAVGKKVRYLHIGDRVIHPNLRTNVGNGYTKTYGGMAEYGLVCDNRSFIEDGHSPNDLPFPLQGFIPSDFDYIDGGVLLSLCESYSAVNNLDIQQNHDILVYGDGPMGQMISKFMKLRGAHSIIMVGHNYDRLAHAKSVSGVDFCINSKTEDTVSIIGNRLFDVVVDAVGSTKLLCEGSYFVKKGGIIASIGVLNQNDRCMNLRNIQNGVKLYMLNYPVGEYSIMPETVGLIQRKLIVPKDYYSHVLPFTQINQAISLIRTRKALKVILSFDNISDSLRV